jgi:hypothetical protein
VSKHFRPDVVLVINGEAPESNIIEQIKVDIHAKFVLWYTDDPRYYDTIVKRIIGCFDFVYTVSPRALGTYKEMDVKNVECLPVACDPNFHRS